MVSPELGIWRCFGACGEGGDVIKFLMKIDNLEFGEALKILAQRTGVRITHSSSERSDNKEQLYEINQHAMQFYHYLLTRHPIGSAALSYIKNERGVTDQTLNLFKIGFAPDKSDALQKVLAEKKRYKTTDLVRAGLAIAVDQKRTTLDRFRNRIVFPLKNHRGEIVGFSGRVLPGKSEVGVGKYVNTPETPIYQKRRHLFGLDITKEDIKTSGCAVIVEGEFDLISCWQAGIKNVVAIKGSAFTQEQVQLLLRFTDELILALDMDEAGIHAARQALMIAEQEGLKVRIARFVGVKDPDEAARKSPEEFKRRINQAQNGYDFFIQEVFRKHDAKTADGVRRISREITPLLAQVNDAIVQAHYVRVLAEKLGVPDDAVGAQIGRVSNKNITANDTSDSVAILSKSRRQLLEERFVSLALFTKPEFLTDENIDGLLTTMVLVRIREELMRFQEGEKKFSPAEFIKSLPSELVDAATSLLLSASSLESDELRLDESRLIQELHTMLRELEILDVQGQISRLTDQIRDEEGKGMVVEQKQADLARLVSTLSQLSRKSTRF